MSAGAFRCGHAKEPLNLKHYVDEYGNARTRCKTCHRAVALKWAQSERAKMTAQERYQQDRMARLPEMLEATRHKLRMLETEARRYGMTDLLEARP